MFLGRIFFVLFFDSSRPQDIDSLDTSFKTLIYDLYSRELSGKVKNAKRMRAEKGLFLSPFAPYGYVKDLEDKNRLIIDDEAADIVRKIFTLTAGGLKPVEIAAMLNRDGVPTPMMYKRAAGCSRDRWPSIHEENFWTQGNIFKILRDERYIGKCVYGKRERDMVGNLHTVKKSKSDWIVVDETHENIVSKELFRTVASRMKEYKEFIPSASERNPLRRKVICGTCGFAMSLSNTKNAKYHCRTSHLKTGFDCTTEGILQADIHEMVVTLIRTYAAYAVSLEHLLLLQKERIQAEKKQARRELAVLQSRRNQLEKSLQDLYEKLIDGTIDKETYISQKASNQAQMQELTEKLGFALAHNGVLYNDVTLRKTEKILVPKIETDSYIAVQLIEKKKALNFETIKYMAEKVEGSFCFTILNNKNELFIVKGDNSMCIAHFKGYYIYASTEAILTKALKKLELKKYKGVKIIDGEILKFSTGGKITKGEFDIFKSYGFYNYPYYSYSRSKTKVIYETEYLNDLIYYGKTVGVDEETILELLDSGYDYMDIEEFLYETEFYRADDMYAEI